MLAEAYADGIFAPTEPLDLFSTDLRYIDGIQLKIIETIENITGLKAKRVRLRIFSKITRILVNNSTLVCEHSVKNIHCVGV